MNRGLSTGTGATSDALRVPRSAFVTPRPQSSSPRGRTTSPYRACPRRAGGSASRRCASTIVRRLALVGSASAISRARLSATIAITRAAGRPPVAAWRAGRGVRSNAGRSLRNSLLRVAPEGQVDPAAKKYCPRRSRSRGQGSTTRCCRAGNWSSCSTSPGSKASRPSPDRLRDRRHR